MASAAHIRCGADAAYMPLEPVMQQVVGYLAARLKLTPEGGPSKCRDANESSSSHFKDSCSRDRQVIGDYQDIHSRECRQVCPIVHSCAAQ